MNFLTKVTSGNEVLFVGSERGNSQLPDAWLASERWKISMPALDAYLNDRLKGQSFGGSVDLFVFGFEIADFEKWADFFKSTKDYVSYRPKSRSIVSVGQIRWTDVKDLPPAAQFRELRILLQTAINRIGTKKRRPRDFAYADFAVTVEALLKQAPEDVLVAKPAK
jgi:hypothetical protein